MWVAAAAAARGFLARRKPSGGAVLAGCVQGEVVETAVPCALEGDAFLCLLRKATLLSYTHVSVAVDQIQTQTQTQRQTDRQRHTHTGMHSCIFGVPGVSTQVQLYILQPGQTYTSKFCG